MKDATMNWFPVDTDTLPANVKTAWGKLQKANEAQRLAKQEFEAAFTTAAKKADRIEGDIALAFGYRFGRLAIAKVDPATKIVKKDAKPKFSF
jgi:hypothetical protein